MGGGWSGACGCGNWLHLRAKEMSRGRCLRDTDVSAADAGDLPDDVAKPPGPPPPPVRTPPTAPTPVSREEAERERT